MSPHFFKAHSSRWYYHLASSLGISRKGCLGLGHDSAGSTTPTWTAMNHVMELAQLHVSRRPSSARRGRRRQPCTREGEESNARSTEACGRRTWGGKQQYSMQHIAEHYSKNSKRGCAIVSNSPSDMIRGKSSNYKNQDLRAAKCTGAGLGADTRSRKWKTNTDERRAV